jgi:hypothetical protein
MRFRSFLGRWVFSVGSGLLALASFLGCRALGPSLPRANLQEPGWTVREGQAVWHLPQSTVELAGEVLVATRADGRAFVQFTKTPFPLVSGQTTRKLWEVDFPPEQRHYFGWGTPPERIIWLYLPRALTTRPLPKNWSWHEDKNGWKLENRTKKEFLEGCFNQ